MAIMMNRSEAVSRKLVDPSFLLRLIRLQQYGNLAFASALLLVVALWGWQRLHPPAMIPVATGRNDRPVAIVPLDRPLLSDRRVLQWTADTVRRAYAINWKNYATHLDRVAPRFTTPAWNSFATSLKKSGNLAKIRSARMVGWVVPDGAARIIDKGVIGPYYTWEILDPVTVRYENQTEQINDALNVKIWVRRASFGHDKAGVAIEQINAIPQ
jgi:hypothetical protein